MIYIDVSAAVHARAGLGRYSQKLVEALIQQQPGRFALFHNFGKGGRLPLELQDVPRRSVRAGYKPWRLAVLLGQLGRLPFNPLIPNATLFHSTEHLLMPLRGIPTILTVHDLIFKLFPEYHKALNYHYLNQAMPLFCRRATAIIAVSEATKRDIVAHYGINPAKIRVVHEAAAEHFRPPSTADIARVCQKYNLPSQFLIHLSTIEPRKNLGRLLDALHLLRRDHPNLHLVLVGAKGWLFDDFFAKIEREGLSHVVCHLGWVPDMDLPAVIGAASLAVQPSLYEGFGLPLLEHMACGQPVAASHRSSFPEVGGDAVAYFNPENVAEMAAVINRILISPEEYHQRRDLGLHQAAKFSWKKTAQETIGLYDALLGK